MRQGRCVEASSRLAGCAGHANGEGKDDIEAYKSCGGYVVILADAAILDDEPAPMAILDWKSAMTQRVCRSTLAAEAAHLANAVEVVDWTAVFLAETLRRKIDLRSWQSEARHYKRFWATDAKRFTSS